MAEHVWSVLCKNMLADDETKVISLMGVVERLILHDSQENLDRSLEGTSGFQHPMRLISWCVRSNPEIEESFEMRAGWHCPSGEPIMGDVIPATLQGFGLRVRVSIDEIPWGGPGVYWLIVQKKDEGEQWATVARLPVQVELQPAT